MKINLILFFLCPLVFISQGQNSIKYNDKNDYFKFIEQKYDVERTSLYYIIEDEDNSFFLPAMTYFIKNDKFVTIDAVSDKLETNCPPKKLFKQLSYDYVSKLIDEQGQKIHIIFKNLSSNEILHPSEDILAVFLFSADFKKPGTKYIKHQIILEELGFKTILHTLDSPSINGIIDFSKINQIRVKGG
jgi:hypothetical protein